MNILRPVLVATALLIFSAVAAFAIPATTRTEVRLYDGPRANFEVLAVLPPGTEVEVIGCSRGWCQVWSDEDEQGFVRERQLDFYDEPPAIIVFPPAIYQFGWSYWQRTYPGDWERWRQRYPRQYRQPPSSGPQRQEPRRTAPLPPPSGPQIQGPGRTAPLPPPGLPQIQAPNRGGPAPSRGPQGPVPDNAAPGQPPGGPSGAPELPPGPPGAPPPRPDR